MIDVVLREFLGIEYSFVEHNLDSYHIMRADDPFGPYVSVDDTFFAMPESQWLQRESLPRHDLVWIRVPQDWAPNRLVTRELPVLFGTAAIDGRLVKQDETSTHIGIDIFGSAFAMLTRYEELVLADRDQHGRFPSSASVARRNEFLERPLVNEYVELLFEALRRLAPQLQRRRRHTKLTLSHDIDRPLMHQPKPSLWRLGRDAYGDLRGRRDPRLMSCRLRSYFGARDTDNDPFNTFDFIMDESERRSLRSAFYVMMGGSDDLYDPGYDVSDPFVSQLLDRITDRGHELGFHPSYATPDDTRQLDVECEAFRSLRAQRASLQPGFGGRQHFLRWRNPRTWQHWEQIGAEYDSTLGYADHVGFRCGCCYEYPVWDLLARRALDLRERPLIAMDGALLTSMGLSPTEAIGKVMELHDACDRVQGDLTLLVHNSTLFSERRKRWYCDLLEAAA